MDHFTIPNEKIVKLELADFPICALSSDEPKIVVGFDDFFSTFLEYVHGFVLKEVCYINVKSFPPVCVFFKDTCFTSKGTTRAMDFVLSLR